MLTGSQGMSELPRGNSTHGSKGRDARSNSANILASSQPMMSFKDALLNGSTVATVQENMAPIKSSLYTKGSHVARQKLASPRFSNFSVYDHGPAHSTINEEDDDDDDENGEEKEGKGRVDGSELTSAPMNEKSSSLSRKYVDAEPKRKSVDNFLSRFHVEEENDRIPLLNVTDPSHIKADNDDDNNLHTVQRPSLRLGDKAADTQREKQEEEDREVERIVEKAISHASNGILDVHQDRAPASPMQGDSTASYLTERLLFNEDEDTPLPVLSLPNRESRLYEVLPPTAHPESLSGAPPTNGPLPLHGFPEFPKSNDICRFHLQGFCNRKDKCNFLHLSPDITALHHGAAQFAAGQAMMAAAAAAAGHPPPPPPPAMLPFFMPNGAPNPSVPSAAPTQPSSSHAMHARHSYPLPPTAPMLGLDPVLVQSLSSQSVLSMPPPSMVGVAAMPSLHTLGSHSFPPSLANHASSTVFTQQQAIHAHHHSHTHHHAHHHPYPTQQPLPPPPSLSSHLSLPPLNQATSPSLSSLHAMHRKSFTEGMHLSNSPALPTMAGQLVALCKDQYGCRFLQKKIEEGPHNVELIYREVYPFAVELMTDAFGNYMCQKLFEHCDEEQRCTLLEVIGPALGTIAVNDYGTRAIQRMVEFLGTAKEIQQMIDCLKGHVVPLIKDLNGNHVVQKCLNRWRAEENQFIYDAVTAELTSVATHRHGCCVLQRCMDHASQGQKMQLVKEITRNALLLVEDAYANYVVQYVLDMNIVALNDAIVQQFAGQVCRLSVQKYSSNVIEKCIRTASADGRALLMQEMILSEYLPYLLIDPFGNYVVQTGLDFVDAKQRAELAESIRPYLGQIRHTPYGKKIQNKLFVLDNHPLRRQEKSTAARHEEDGDHAKPKTVDNHPGVCSAGEALSVLDLTEALVHCQVQQQQQQQ